MKMYGGQNKPAKTAKPKKKIKPHRLAILIVGIVIALGLSAWGILHLVAKPPDVSVDKTDKTDKNDKEDLYADLAEPFVDSGDKTRKKDFYTFMICGTDNDGTRTDTIIVASYNIKTQTVNMVNIPRDTMSNVKRKIKKINSGFNGGPDQLKEELQMLIGIPIDRYAVIDFKGFIQLIDLIGGVDFDVPTYMVWDDPTQDLHIFLEPGMQHLDGAKAIQLVRFRQNNPGVKGGYAEGDIGRIKMQQNFLRTVAKKVLSLSNVMKLNDMASAIFDNTKTDMSMNEILWFGLRAMKMDFNNINMTTLPGHDAYLYEPDYGHMQSYYVPEEDKILTMVNELLNPYEEPVTQLNLIDVSRYSSEKPSGSSKSSSSSSSSKSSSAAKSSSSKTETNTTTDKQPDTNASTTQPGNSGDAQNNTQPSSGDAGATTPSTTAP